ncbi:sensor histidine kinase [Poritiphilus flavus]|uniref:histidine kinase n=1 Tax=Poritiphilus flavus TaxID=2697053 RepID=A0A6L9E9X8_9FLAO|nr:ATP-binding protein [Poritiphilus flavus]NAS11607.1 histidine kinase [Poritiphilus flavus]
MISRNFYFQLILRVIFLALTAIITAFLFFGQNYFLSVLFLILFVIQAGMMANHLNHINRKLAYFFDAIRNEDFTLRFPEKDIIKSFKNLNHSLNRVNELIQEVHLKKQEQEQYYQEIIKQATIGILTYNQRGHILFSNPTMERLFNHSPLNHIKQLNQVDPLLYETFAKFEPFERKMVPLTNEREKTQLAIKSTALRLEEEDLLLVVAQDIHRELDEKETDSWVRLIRVLTHEIMNTITPITSISGSILGYFRTPGGLVSLDSFKTSHIESTVKGLEVIQEQGGNLMAFVQSYRSLLNVAAPDKELIKAKVLLDKVGVLMDQALAANKVSLVVQAHPEDLELFIDERQMTQVLVNLSKNAIQALGNTDDSQLQLLAGVRESGIKYVEVQDNGPGIPAELLDEIFVPFFTTKSEGTGIGLSLSKRLVQMHGGSLDVYSEAEHGTVFILEFP